MAVFCFLILELDRKKENIVPAETCDAASSIIGGDIWFDLILIGKLHILQIYPENRPMLTDGNVVGFDRNDATTEKQSNNERFMCTFLIIFHIITF